MNESSDSSLLEKGRPCKICTGIAIRQIAAIAKTVSETHGSREGEVMGKTPTKKDWNDHVYKDWNNIFRQLYRMSLNYFNVLLARIQHNIETKNKYTALKSSGSPICVELVLSMTLSYLAGGLVWHVRSNFKVSIAEI